MELEQTFNLSQKENFCHSMTGDDHLSDLVHTVVELNVCTLFGLLLGYPIVYCFDTKRGYSLDMVDLVCYTLTISSIASDSVQSDSAIRCSVLFVNIR